MSYDDDQAYDAERDRKLDTTFHRRLVVDKDYMAVTRHDPFYIFKKSPVELFSVVCKNLVAGMRIAVKIKDNDLPSRFWIVDGAANHVKDMHQLSVSTFDHDAAIVGIDFGVVSFNIINTHSTYYAVVLRKALNRMMVHQFTVFMTTNKRAAKSKTCS